MEIAIIGTGNVGTHLVKAYANRREIRVKGISSRSLEGLTGNEEIWLLTVSDNAITPLAEKLSNRFPNFKGIVAHTAGSISIEALEPYFKRNGVFYPLQTFSKDISIRDYSVIPIFIEGSTKEDEMILIRLAEKVFSNVYTLTSNRRQYLHLMAVFACNFTNAMYAACEEIGSRNDIPFTTMVPLIEQTLEKVKRNKPTECQTGPAARDDIHTIERHLELLEPYTGEKELYQLITKYIQNKIK